jgi:hypothetical protein
MGNISLQRGNLASGNLKHLCNIIYSINATHFMPHHGGAWLLSFKAKNKTKYLARY